MSFRCFPQFVLLQVLALGLCGVAYPVPAEASPPRPELLRDPAFRARAQELYRLAEEGRARAARAAPSAAPLALTASGKNVVTVGRVRPLLLLVDFPDRFHNPEGHEPADYAGIFFDDPGNSATPPNTVREYFGEVSYGNLLVEGDAASVASWQQLASASTFYLGPDQGLTFGPLLVRDAVLSHDDAVDFRLFDNDGPDGIPDSGDDDGVVDALVVVHAGWGWEDSGSQGVDPSGSPLDDFASHYSPVDIPTNDVGHDGQPIRVADYILVPEESYKLDLVQNREDLEPPFFAVIDNDNEPLAEIGVYAHELGHVLGLPDLYDTTFQSYGIGTYGLMGYGLWGPDYDGGATPETSRLHNQPTHPCAWSKTRLGWLSPTVVWRAATDFSLPEVENAADARLLYADSEGSQYFLLEHRKPVGYDAGFFPAGGLLVTHVDEAALSSGGMRPNDNRFRKGVDVECANGFVLPDLDDLDEMVTFSSVDHLYFQPREFGPATSPDTSTADGRATGIDVFQLTTQSTGTRPMAGLASAGTVVLNPRSLLVRPADGAFVVEWSPLPAGSDTQGYRVYLTPQGVSETLAQDVADPAAESVRLEGLANGLAHTLRLTAYDDEFSFATGDFNESDGVLALATPVADVVPPVVTLSPAPGVYNQPLQVALGAEDDVDPRPDLFYSTDGSPPAVPHAGPIPVGGAGSTVTVTVAWRAVDASFNETTGAGTYTVDAVPPVITVLGGDPLTHEAATPYTDPGATASDDRDGDLTGAIAVANPVDPSVPASYLVTYDVSDSAGNAAAQATRTVNVVDTTPPTVNPPPNVSAEATGPLTDVNLGLATATDAVDGDLPTSSDAPPAGFPVGDTVVAWTATDAAGNVGSAPQLVTVTDTTPPTLTLLGDDPLQVEAGTAYADPGAAASDLVDGDLTNFVVIGGDTVDPNVLGPYAVTYDVSDSSGNAADQAVRAVNVADTTPPVITVLGDDPLHVEAGTSYADPGATAEDSFEGDLTASVVTGGDAVDPGVLGPYAVTYDVSDSSGNTAVRQTRIVTVADTVPPVLALLGDAVVSLEQGQRFLDPGAAATDSFEGDLTASIVVGGDPVDTAAPGTYVLTYDVSDSSGNAAPRVLRAVTVVAVPPQDSDGGGGGGGCFLSALGAKD
jgi:M6 family metalloprotease-like protein